MRETKRKTDRLELKPTYLELPPLSIGCNRSKRSSQEQASKDYLERRRRRRLVKLIQIQGVKSDLNRLSARRSVDLFLLQSRILQLALHTHQWNQT